MYFLKIIKYIKFFDYYLEYFAKRLSGKENMIPESNGEFYILEKIIKLCPNEKMIFFDVGSNVGAYLEKIINLSLKYKKIFQILSAEPTKETFKLLKEKYGKYNINFLNNAIGKNEKMVPLYCLPDNNLSGQNSIFAQSFLNSNYKVQQKTIDQIVKENEILSIDFLKLDIEGAECDAIEGAQESLKKKIIKYIIMEYNRTWIASNGSIEKIFNYCKKYNYDLYRIKKNTLLSISYYHHTLDDFSYCNLLLVKQGEKKPASVEREAIPYVIRKTN